MKPPTDPTIYEFDNFRIDGGRRLFFNGGDGPIPLTSKVFDTLLYLVTHNGTVIDKDELMSAIWPDTIVEENNLNKNISVLRRVLGENPGEHRYIVTVPGKGYKFVASVVESSANGIKFVDIAHADITLQRSGPSRATSRSKKFAFAAIGVMALVAVLALSYTYFFRRRSIHSIAVMAFANESGDPKLEYLSDGMTGDLIESLSKVPDLDVKALSTVVRYKGANSDARRIGQELNVEAVLFTHLIETGEDLTLQVELVDSRNENNLWRRTYQKKKSGLVVLQSELARDLVHELSVPITDKTQEKLAKRDTENSDAYLLYLRGVILQRKLTEPDIKKAIELFSQAILKDPEYARAYAAIASAHRSLTMCCDGHPSELVQAKLAAQKAVELDDELAEGHSALASLIFSYDWNWAKAEKEYLRALELDPNSSMSHFLYAEFLNRMARRPESNVEGERARELEPFSPFFNAFGANKDKDPAKAVERIRFAIDLDPDFYFSHSLAAFIYSGRGMYAEAIEEARLSKKLSPDQTWSDVILSNIFVNAGRPEESRAILDQLLLRSKSRFVPPYHIAMVYNNVGDKERALDWLEKAYAIRDPKMTFLKTMNWKNVENDPRFQDILRRVGLAGAK
jgi:DNA-binding winged helix-turn-helix (wHTH) protein/TolB-like protein